jgi:pimeloyl-ACP methyl ester carboxylesterase
LLAFLAALCAAVLGVATQLPSIGAWGLLRPVRRSVTVPPPEPCSDAVFAGDGVELRGWMCAAGGTRRGTIVYLHGVADNRTSARGVVSRFVPRGFDVVAYDSRAHGESTGDVCSYGFFEKQDLRRVLDTLAPGPVVLLGSSLGAAVALQAAAEDRRVSGVIAAETFSDLRVIATERAPSFFTADVLSRAFALVESHGRFRVDDVSPRAAAAAIVAPVLLIHGEADTDTPPAHSKRVLAALRGPKRLLLVPGAAHNGSLRAHVWNEIDSWLDEALEGDAPSRA